VLSWVTRKFIIVWSKTVSKIAIRMKICAKCAKKNAFIPASVAIVCIDKRVTSIANEVLTSSHDCVFHLFDIDLQLPKRLANSKLFTRSCSEHPFCDSIPVDTVYCTKQNHCVFKQPQFPCKLCVKDGPASLKSICVNKKVKLFSIQSL